MRHSAVLIIPAALLTQANAMAEAMGWGPTTFTVPLGDGGAVTHWGARPDVSAQFIRWIRGVDPLPDGMEAAQPIIDALVADFSPDPAYDGDDPPPVLWGLEHFEAVIAAQGLQRTAPVNINTADAGELSSRLSGVGASLAQAIIDGRPWAAPADLAQIGGISAAMIEGWQADPGLEV